MAIAMTQRVIELTALKRELAHLPESKLHEVREFIRRFLSGSGGPDQRNVRSLEGIWAGLGWETVNDPESEIRKLRSEGSRHALDRNKDWNT